MISECTGRRSHGRVAGQGGTHNHTRAMLTRHMCPHANRTVPSGSDAWECDASESDARECDRNMMFNDPASPDTGTSSVLVQPLQKVARPAEPYEGQPPHPIRANQRMARGVRAHGARHGCCELRALPTCELACRAMHACTAIAPHIITLVLYASQQIWEALSQCGGCPCCNKNACNLMRCASVGTTASQQHALVGSKGGGMILHSYIHCAGWCC